MAIKRKKPSIIRIVGAIDEESFLAFSEALAILEGKGVKAVEVELSSSGGVSYDGLAFYERMRISPCSFRVTAYGIVASAASIILVCADKRRMTRESWLMVHEDSGQPSGSTTDLEVTIKHLRTMETQWNKLIEERSDVPVSAWNEIHKRDTYLNAEQCLKLGLIDEVI